MPGETNPTPDEITAEIDRNTIQSDREEAGEKAGYILDKDLARAMAEKQLEVRNEAEAKEAELKANPNNVRKTDNELTKRARTRVEKILSKSQSEGEAAGRAQVESGLKERAKKEAGYEANEDKAFEMASAEYADRTMADNLTDIGSPDLAKGRVEQAKAQGEKAGQTYKTEMDKALTDVDTVSRGPAGGRATLRGEQTKITDSYIEAVAGRGAQPVFEMDKGRGSTKIHESYYQAGVNAETVSVVRQNARTGEVISVHTMKLERTPFTNKRGVKVPSGALQQAMQEPRAKDKELGGQAISGRGTPLEFPPGASSVGELNYLRQTGFGYNPGEQFSLGRTESALNEYRKKQRQQSRASFWDRLFGGL
ncbi:MAG TPA: hypothetical protein VLE72_00885 [Candidatus Saccharimonadales bacterium]|nr:hypothetical protein [Candidatus Saccharimonadales bacterium]